MKKLIFSAVLLAGMVATSYGQGTVLAGNVDNNDQINNNATSNGAFWIDLDGTAGAGAPVLMDGDTYPTLNYTLMGGSTAGSMTLITTLTGDNALANGDLGIYYDQAGVPNPVPGVPTGGTGFFQVFAWEGADTDYASAVLAGAAAGSSTVFQNPVDTGSGAASMTHMPAVILEVVPEPGTFALAGLGAAALLIFRRRK